MICKLRTNMSRALIFHSVSSKENNFIIYFLMPHYAKSADKTKIQTEISRQQNVGARKYKRTCITVYIKGSFT